MKRVIWILTVAASWMHCGGIPEAGAKTPALRFVEEHTSTRDIRDMALFAGRLWTATQGGIAVYDRDDGRFLFKLTSIHGLFGNSVRALAPTENGTLLAAGDFGVAEISPACTAPGARCFEKVTLLSPAVYDPVVAIVGGARPWLLGHQSGLRPHGLRPHGLRPHGLRPHGMWQAAVRGLGGILMGGMDGRLVLSRGEQEEAVLTMDKPVTHIVAVTEGFLVLSGAAVGLVRDGRVRPVLLGARARAVTAIAPARRGAIAGGAQGELYSVLGGELTLLGRAPGRITALLEDGDGIWLGLEGRGLARFSRGRRAALPVVGPASEICSNHVTRVTRMGQRAVVGTFDNGACVLTESGWQMLEGMAGQYVHGVAFDGRLLWVATSNGIARFSEDLTPAPLTERDPKEVRWFDASAVTALTETDEGVALGAPWGVVTVALQGDAYTARFISRFRGAPEHITALAGAPGGLLAASETEGVRFLGRGRKETRVYLDPVHLPEAWILDVSSADTGFWAASCQQGVAFSDDASGRFIDASAGLADNRTVGVAAYGDGAFVATLSGLSFAHRSAVARAPFDGPLPDPRGATVEVRGDTLYFGTEAGTAVFEIVP